MTAVLFKNGIFPLAADHQSANAIYVENGRIKAIGQASDLELQLSGRLYQTVDWEGAYVLPGLVDSHMHLGMHGMKLSMLDFTGVTSKEEMLRLIRERAAVTPAGEWITGLNWNENEFTPAEAPTRQELDEVTDRHPVFLTRTCFHAFLGNSEAFLCAGIPEGAPDPASGAFGRHQDGSFNGWIYEEACYPFEKVQPEPDYETKKAAIRRASLDALSLGLTGAHTEDLRFLGSVETMLRIHRELREEGLALRSHQLMFHAYMEEVAELGVKAGSGDEWTRIGAMKIFADGAIGGRTALLQEPYSDAPDTKGMAIQTTEQLHELVAKARRHGYPIAVHAIGDGAADLTLGAMEKLPLGSASGLPDRFIHAQVLDRGLLERMKKLPLIADIQPRFVASDFPWVLERVGPDRQDVLYAWRTLMDAGIVCAGGSDAPIEPLNPFLGLHAAVTRRRPGQQGEGYLPLERLTLQQALHLFTLGSAAAVGEERERGSIEVGKYADFTVIDTDLTEDVDALLEVKVKMSIVNGQIAYSADR
ncbi:amidohydrolase [Paenibacillus physcomitrellae]|uniref:Amidohydrolase n=1 Tax=Paenibacillus physcomitrellae TaxID=1619311 RepID=A0ABQ1G848_9BACL|nr:amidohydrolase [Paenibacillus physcomitrellae]GGA38584.1 amidohydrolase [Paenibacillus physcomitrellae]